MTKTELTKVKEAAAYIEKAIMLLHEARGYRNYECSHFAQELEEILSCDNGEAGIKAYIEIIESGE